MVSSDEKHAIGGGHIKNDTFRITSIHQVMAVGICSISLPQKRAFWTRRHGTKKSLLVNLNLLPAASNDVFGRVAACVYDLLAAHVRRVYVMRDPGGDVLLGLEDYKDYGSMMQVLQDHQTLDVAVGDDYLLTLQIGGPAGTASTPVVTYVVSFMYESTLDMVDLDSIGLDRMFSSVGSIVHTSRNNPTTSAVRDTTFDKLFVTVRPSGACSKLPKGKKLRNGRLFEIYPLYATNSRFCEYCYSPHHVRQACTIAPSCRICKVKHASSQCPQIFKSSSRSFGTIKDRNIAPKQQKQTQKSSSPPPLFSQVEVFFSMFVYS